MFLTPRLVCFSFFIVSIAIFFAQIVRYVQTLRKAAPENRTNHPGQRLLQCFKLSFGHQRLLNEITGIAHLFIFYAFILLLIDIIELLIQCLSPAFTFQRLLCAPIYSAMKCTHDFFAVAALAAVTALAIRRVVKRKTCHNTPEAFAILGLIAVLMLTQLLGTAALCAMPTDEMPFTAPVAEQLSALLFSGKDSDTLHGLYTLFSLVHLTGVAIFFILIPLGKHLHIVTAFFNTFSANQNFIRGIPQKTERFIDVEAFSEVYEKAMAETPDAPPPSFGAAQLFDLSWKQLLDPLACSQCRRCTNVCPVQSAGGSLSPMHQGLHLRKLIEKRQNAELLPAIASPEEIWQCTTCGACEAVCPITVEHTIRTIDIRRNLVFSEKYPKELDKLFNNIERSGNPWGYPKRQRGDWAAQLKTSQPSEAPILIFAGCSAAYDPKQQHFLSIFIKLLEQMDIPFVTLRDKETCCGEPLRKTGNEMGFQDCVRKNLAQIENLKPSQILTLCPHCAHTLRHAYAQFADMPPVHHALEFLYNTYSEGKLAFKNPFPHNITYHDPCYLTKYNDLSVQTRKLLKAVPGLNLIENTRSPKKSHCCGSGGGHFFLPDSPLPAQRASEIRATHAEALATACPFCYETLSDALKQRHVADETTGCVHSTLMNTLNVIEILTFGAGAVAQCPETGQQSPGEAQP